MQKSLNNRSYLIVNISLLAIFLLAFLYFFFNKEPMRCYYEEHYNYLCSTCGITRDFKSILKFRFEELINAKSLYYFGTFLFIFSSRVIVTLLLWKNFSLKKIVRADIFALLVLTLFIFVIQFDFA